MKQLAKKGFTLVELLVVITILAIISVVAYQNFWGAVDRAVSSRKISDVTAIESSLIQYKAKYNYYPAVDEYNATTNMWWYNKTANTDATASNTIQVKMDWAEIDSLIAAAGGWVVKNKDGTQQIWAKWTISQATLTKDYLSKDLYDPEIWDYKVKSTGKKLIDYWVGRYVYSVYRKPTWPTWDNSNKTGTYYNIAYTIRKDDSDTYITKIVWDYDSGSCFEEKDNCPLSLIGSWDNALIDWQAHGKKADWTDIATSYGSKSSYQWIPYSTNDFEE